MDIESRGVLLLIFGDPKIQPGEYLITCGPRRQVSSEWSWPRDGRRQGAGKEGGAHAEQAEVAPVEEEAVPVEQEVEEEPAEEGPVGPAAKASGRTAPAEAGGTTTEAVEVAQAFLVHFTLPPCAWRGVVRRALAVLSSVLLGSAGTSGTTTEAAEVAQAFLVHFT